MISRGQPRILASAFVLLLGGLSAFSQEPTFMDAATHPGAGQLYSRLLVFRSEYEEAGTDLERDSAVLKLSYGIQPTLALVCDGELADVSGEGAGDSGLSQATFQLKYRLFKRDLSPLNTWRTSIFGGVTIPGDVDAYGPADTYPRCSVASTAILGRHGLNLQVAWEEDGDEPDRVAVNASHLYRLSPSEYTATTRGAWYTMVESLNDFSDTGDSRSDVALGVLYEARRWAWETSARLPVAQEWPREVDYVLAMGIRYLP